VLSSSVPLTTPGPTDGARADAEEEAEDPIAAQPDEQRTRHRHDRHGNRHRGPRGAGGEGLTFDRPMPGARNRRRNNADAGTAAEAALIVPGPVRIGQ